jgi:pimeloyl-ACP methyl ester carboxylesterase
MVFCRLGGKYAAKRPKYAKKRLWGADSVFAEAGGLQHDQIVPIGASAQAAAQIDKNATLKIYPGAPHGLTSTHADQFNADLLAILEA